MARIAHILDERSNYNRCSEGLSRGVRTAENQALMSEVEESGLEIVLYQVVWNELH